MSDAAKGLNIEGWRPLDESLMDGRWVMIAIYNAEGAAADGLPPWQIYKAKYQWPHEEGHTGWWHESGGFWRIPTLYREIEPLGETA